MDRPRLKGWRLAGLGAAFLAAAGPAAAAAPSLVIDHETVTVLGWNKDCSVAVAHYGFPRLGEGIADHPVRTRLGTMTIEPGEQKAHAEWNMEREGPRSWSAGTAADVRRELTAAGYTLPGWHERVRAAAPPEQELSEALLSTAAFRTLSKDLPAGFPGRLRLAEIYYSPEIASCGLLVFQAGETPFYELRLVRIEVPMIRKDRARVHLRAARLWLDRQDRKAALEESAIAAELAPEDAPARFYHSLQLLLDGQTEPALDELERSIKLDPAYKKKARQDRDFSEWAWLPRFQEMTR